MGGGLDKLPSQVVDMELVLLGLLENLYLVHEGTLNNWKVSHTVPFQTKAMCISFYFSFFMCIFSLIREIHDSLS